MRIDFVKLAQRGNATDAGINEKIPLDQQKREILEYLRTTGTPMLPFWESVLSEDPAATKRAGWSSEMLGQLNPLNLYGGNVIGGLAAATTPTKDTEDMAEEDTRGIGNALLNLLVPTRAPYKAWKRVGYSVRNPDLEKTKEKVEDKKEKEKKKEEDAKDKE